jgi:hypothetical protein
VVAGSENLVATTHAFQLCAEGFCPVRLLRTGHGSGQQKKCATQKRPADFSPARNGDSHSTSATYPNHFSLAAILARTASGSGCKDLGAENFWLGYIRASYHWLSPFLMPVDQKDI